MARSVLQVVGEYIVPVDYDLPHREQILATRCDVEHDHCEIEDYERMWKPPRTNIIPVPSGQCEKRIMLIPFDLGRYASTEEVLDILDCRNQRPTLSAETLAFMKAYPDYQEPFSLQGLGSRWFDSDRRPLVLHLGNDYYLSMIHCDCEFAPRGATGFLVVTK